MSRFSYQARFAQACAGLADALETLDEVSLKAVLDSLEERPPEPIGSDRAHRARAIVDWYDKQDSLILLLCAARARRPSDELFFRFEVEHCERFFDGALGGPNEGVSWLDQLATYADRLQGADAIQQFAVRSRALLGDVVPAWCELPRPGPYRRALLALLAEQTAERGKRPPLVRLVFEMAEVASDVAVRRELHQWARTTLQRMRIDSASLQVVPARLVDHHDADDHPSTDKALSTTVGHVAMDIDGTLEELPTVNHRRIVAGRDAQGNGRMQRATGRDGSVFRVGAIAKLATANVSPLVRGRYLKDELLRSVADELVQLGKAKDASIDTMLGGVRPEVVSAIVTAGKSPAERLLTTMFFLNGLAPDGELIWLEMMLANALIAIGDAECAVLPTALDLLRRPGAWTPAIVSRLEMPEISTEMVALAKKLGALYVAKAGLTRESSSWGEVNAAIRSVKLEMLAGPELKPGTLLGDGRFQLLGRVGQGGFGVVWKALDHQQRDAEVAVKILHYQLGADATARKRFYRGAKWMARIKHDNVVSVVAQPALEEYSEGKIHFFVMEYLPTDLRRAVVSGELVGVEALRKVIEVGRALTQAHNQGVFHRDVSPDNILIASDGTVKLTDFDLVSVDDTVAGTRQAMGKFYYAAPEVQADASAATARSDLYSLAMTSVFVLFGKDLPPAAVFARDAFCASLRCSTFVRDEVVRAVSLEFDQRHLSVAAFCDALADALARNEQTPVEAPPLAAANEVVVPIGDQETGIRSLVPVRSRIKVRVLVLVGIVTLLCGLAVEWRFGIAAQIVRQADGRRDSLVQVPLAAAIAVDAADAATARLAAQLQELRDDIDFAVLTLNKLAGRKERPPAVSLIDNGQLYAYYDEKMNVAYFSAKVLHIRDLAYREVAHKYVPPGWFVDEESGALASSFVDVLTWVVHEKRGGNLAGPADWVLFRGLPAVGMIGKAAELNALVPAVSFDAPGTAFDGDVQVGHWGLRKSGFGTTSMHPNAGIGNRAFRVAASTLGTDAAARVWVAAARATPPTFASFATATTVEANRQVNDDARRAVFAAWKEVGVDVK